MGEWTQTIALVTGGGHGIGRSTALAMASRGARVHICGRTFDALEQTSRLAESLVGQIVIHEIDVTDEGAVLSMMSEIREADQRLDVLINNAGMLGPRTPLEEVSLEDWTKTLAVNCTGVFLVSQKALPLLRQAQGAVVINLSSSVGRVGRGGWGAYSVSKHGVEGLTDVLSEELEGDGIIVVSLNPGGTATRMRAEAYPEEDPESLPEAEDVAETIVYLVGTLELEQSGGKYSSRELFELTR